MSNKLRPREFWIAEKELVEALEKVCKRNDIPEAVLDYYGNCAMALQGWKTFTGDEK